MNCNQRRQIHYAIKFVILQNYSPIFIKSRTSITNLNDKKYRIERSFLFYKISGNSFQFFINSESNSNKKKSPPKKEKKESIRPLSVFKKRFFTAQPSDPIFQEDQTSIDLLFPIILRDNSVSIDRSTNKTQRKLARFKLECTDD